MIGRPYGHPKVAELRNNWHFRVQLDAVGRSQILIPGPLG